MSTKYCITKSEKKIPIPVKLVLEIFSFTPIKNKLFCSFLILILNEEKIFYNDFILVKKNSTKAQSMVNKC